MSLELQKNTESLNTVRAQVAAVGLAVRELMNPKPAFVQENATIAEAAQCMLTEGIRHLSILNADNKLSGFLSESDLIKLSFFDENSGQLLQPENWSKTPVKQVMKQDFLGQVTTPASELSLRSAASLMEERKISSLVIANEEGDLQGVLSETDFLALVLAAGYPDLSLPPRFRQERPMMASAALQKGNLRISDMMSVSPEFVSATQTLRAAEEIMHRKAIRHLLVKDHNQNWKGVISYRDILRACHGEAASLMENRQDRGIPRLPVEAFMNSDSSFLKAQDSLKEAARILWEKKLGFLPIVTEDSKNPAGLITRGDFIAFFAGGL